MDTVQLSKAIDIHKKSLTVYAIIEAVRLFLYLFYSNQIVIAVTLHYHSQGSL